MRCMQLGPGRRHTDWHRNRPSCLQSLPIPLRLPISLRLSVSVLPTLRASVLLRLSVSGLRSSGSGVRTACARLSGADVSATADLCAASAADLWPASGHGANERLSGIGPALHASAASAATDASAADGAAIAADVATSVCASAVGRRSAVFVAGVSDSAGSDSSAAGSTDPSLAAAVSDSESAGIGGFLGLPGVRSN